MTTQQPHITWERTPYNGWRGSLRMDGTTVEIATISWSSIRNDPAPWILRTDLPGWRQERSFDVADDAKAAAERMLRAFVRLAWTAVPVEVSE